MEQAASAEQAVVWDDEEWDVAGGDSSDENSYLCDGTVS